VVRAQLARLDQVPASRLVAETLIAVVAMPLWLLAIPHLPILAGMPGLAVMIAFILAALVLHPRPALAVVAIGAIGFEWLRPAASPQEQVARPLLFALIGSAVVSLAYARTTRYRRGQLYRTLFDQHPLPMWMFDEDTLRFLAVNEAAVRAYGYSHDEFARITLGDIRPPEDLARTADGPAQSTGAWRHRTKDGRVLEVFVRSQPIDVPGRRARLALIEDMTDRRTMEEQFRQAQKMEAIGLLAGGVAHDFNNLLTAIRGFAALLLDSLDPDDERRADAEEIDRAGARAASLTQQLLAFSRKQLLQVRVISLSDTVDEMVPMLRRVVSETIELRTRLDAQSRIEADPGQLQQILMNLVVNGRDALPPEGGGRITIETQDVDLDETYASLHAEVTPGPHAVLMVSDTGHGMDASTRTRIFEPFFTTKPLGQGTGLGLSTVYGIVKQSGGHVWVYSEVGYGTTFKVYFPVTEKPAVTAHPSPAQRGQLATGTILVVEDEEAVRSLLGRLLQREGYTVLLSDTPVAARAVWERADVSIDLLITDVVLPEMNGREVADAVQKHHPACRVLFISGYTREGVLTTRVLHEDAVFLQKPFTAIDLRRSVANLLNAGDVTQTH
jgi:PAS domain S-box-containing protein